MIIAALVFGLAILAFSLLFLFRYVQNDKLLRESRTSLMKLRQRQLTREANLQARMDAEMQELEQRRRWASRQPDDRQNKGHRQRDVDHAA